MKKNGIYKHHRDVLRQLGLPANLLDLMRSRKLERAVEAAYKKWETVVALMDEFEEAEPVTARSCLWYEERQKWKAQGRQRPEWWEVLQLGVPPYRKDMKSKWNSPRKTWLSSHEIKLFQQHHQRDWRRRDAQRIREAKKSEK